MATSMHSFVQRLDCTVHSCYVRKTSTAFFLAVVLMISGAFAPLPGTKGSSALAQDKTCLDALTDTNSSAELTTDVREYYSAVIDRLKKSDKFIKEKIDIFTYAPTDNSYAVDVDTLHVSLQTPTDSECTWGSGSFFCYRIRADVARDTGELLREAGYGGMYVRPGKIFEVIREKPTGWRLEDGDNTFVVVGLNGETVNLETSSGEMPDNLEGSYSSKATEIPIPSSGMLSFTLSGTAGYDYDYQDYSYSVKNFRVSDNSVFAIEIDSAGNAKLHPVSCQADGSLR